MTVLAQADIDAILAFVNDIPPADEAGMPFSGHVLQRLRDLARADQIIFSELDRVRQRTIGITWPGGVVPVDDLDTPRPSGHVLADPPRAPGVRVPRPDG